MPPDSSHLNPFTDFCYLFLSIILEGAPFIFLGTLISGFIDAYLPPGLIDRFLPRKKHLAVVVSALLGIFLPVCECAVVPVIRRLIRKGLPVSCAITYMLSAPIINPIVVFSTMNAFSSSKGKFLIREVQQIAEGPLFVTLSRLGIAFIVTVGTGWVILKMRTQTVLRPDLFRAIQKPEPQADPRHGHGLEREEHTAGQGGKPESGGHDAKHARGSQTAAGPAAPDKLVLAMRSAMRDFVDVAMYFTIGVAITAIFRAYVSSDLVLLFNQSEFIGINLMMILAFVLSLCSTSDAFIAANFPVPLSAKLSFLVFGPMMDVKLIFMYLSVFRKRFVAGLAVLLFVTIGTLCYLWVHAI